MKYLSAFKALILCQLPGNHSFQGYSQLKFLSLVGLPHSASQCSPSHVGPPHTMWVRHIQDFHFRWVRHLLIVAYRVIRILHFPHLWVRHTMSYIIPPHMWVRLTVRNVRPPHLGFLFPVGPPPSSLCNHTFQSYQNPVKSGS